MSGMHQCCSARESIVRKKKLMELEDTMFRQDSNMGPTPLRLVNAELPRRKKSVWDLEQGWSNTCTGDMSKRSSSTTLPCFGFKDKGIHTAGDLFWNELAQSKNGEKVDKGWVSNFKEQKTKELDEVYGKDLSRMKSVDRRLHTARVGNCKDERRGKMRSKFTAAELHKFESGRRHGSVSNSGIATQRSDTSISRAPGSPRERTEISLNTVWVRSSKRTGIEAESLLVDRSYGDLSDVCAHASRLGSEKVLDADMRWMTIGSPRREGSGQGVPKICTITEEMTNKEEDNSQENSWFNPYRHGERRELFGLRSYSIGDYVSKKVNREDLSWAANCRAKLKAQMTIAS